MRKAFQDLSGQRFGRWTVLARAPNAGRKTRFFVRCDCGNEGCVSPEPLKRGESTSCGCFRREFASAQFKTHGRSKSREYNVWSGVIDRCCNPNNMAYDRYGGRGIGICARWKDGDGTKSGYECFIEDMGPQPSFDMSLDRINNDLGYSPENCRWATRTEQCNNRRSSVTLTWNGLTLTKAEWARRQGLTQGCIRDRLEYGWSVEKTLSTPRDQRKVMAGKKGAALRLNSTFELNSNIQRIQNDY